MQDFTGHAKAELNQSFYYFDTDEDGLIDQDQLGGLLHTLSTEGYVDAGALMAEFDKKGEGKINFKTFLKIVRKVKGHYY